jgi:hypothetical protein
MIRSFLRLLGLLCMAGAFIFLVYDGTKSIAGSMFYFTRFEEMWNALYSRGPQDLIKPPIERYVGPWLWDPVMVQILTAPTWMIFGVLGIILIVLGRRKKPLIGYTRD